MANNVVFFLITAIILVITVTFTNVEFAFACSAGTIPKINSNGDPIMDPHTGLPICVAAR